MTIPAAVLAAVLFVGMAAFRPASPLARHSVHTFSVVGIVLNTLGNLASKSRLEKTVFAATTAALAALSAYVAVS